LCGSKALRSKLPKCICTTGISSGASSAVKTSAKLVRAEVMDDSGRWKAGRREDIIEGVRSRTEGLGAAAVRSGRKVCRVKIGVRRRVLRISESVDGESVAMGCEGYVRDGMRIRERRER
jgi:hypothetical protein